MKTVEVFKTDSRSSKLTITQTRIIIKFQEGLDDKEAERVKTFFILIAEAIGDLPYSVRGTLFRDSTIMMQRNSGKVIGQFDMN